MERTKEEEGEILNKNEGGFRFNKETKILRTKVLSVRPLVALHVQQRVSVVDEASSFGTQRHILTLAVSGDEEAVGRRG